jgi:hypothetical protein
MAEQNPLAKYQLQKFGGAGRRNNEGMFTNVNGNASRDARRAARREQRPMTFAEMQSDGVARPAPDMTTMFTGGQSNLEGLGLVNVGPTYVPQSGLDDLTRTGDATPPVNPASPSSPSPTGGSSLSTYEAMRRAALANLEAQFGAQRQSLEDEMARRGLAASSISAGRFGDLAGQQARALATTEADLLAQDQARRNSQNELLLRLATLFGLG